MTSEQFNIIGYGAETINYHLVIINIMFCILLKIIINFNYNLNNKRFQMLDKCLDFGVTFIAVETLEHFVLLVVARSSHDLVNITI